MRIVTKDNEETEFVVVEVTDEAIVGENQKVLFTDIIKLQEQTVSAGENFGIITIITLHFDGHKHRSDYVLKYIPLLLLPLLVYPSTLKI